LVDIQRDHYRLWQDRRAAFWRDRAQLRADHRELWHELAQYTS
jgi:hypothetical protein